MKKNVTDAAFFSGFLRYIIRIDDLKNVINGEIDGTGIREGK